MVYQTLFAVNPSKKGKCPPCCVVAMTMFVFNLHISILDWLLEQVNRILMRNKRRTSQEYAVIIIKFESTLKILCAPSNFSIMKTSWTP